MNHLPSVDTTYNMIICKERHEIIAWDQDARAEASAFAARVPNKSSIICSVCHKYGHSSLECFQVIGFPKRWPDKNKTQSRNSNGHGKNSKHGSARWGRGGGRAQPWHTQLWLQPPTHTGCLGILRLLKNPWSGPLSGQIDVVSGPQQRSSSHGLMQNLPGQLPQQWASQ